MAYFIEFGQNPRERFYLQVLLADTFTGELIKSMSGCDHQFSISDQRDDYGTCCDAWQLLASNSNGLVTQPNTGLIVIDIPPDRFGRFASCGRNEIARIEFRAVPADPAKATVLFNGSIAFGDHY